MKTDPLILCWTLFVIVWAVAALSVKQTVERQSRGSRLATIAYLTLAFMLLAGKIRSFGLDTRILPAWAALYFAGEVVAFIGLVIAVGARCYLGRNWSGTVTFKEGHELIERGPYRFVRHPIYTGMLLMILGTALVLGLISSFAALFIFFAGTWLKLRREEALMLKHFPDTYPGYMTRTKAIIPFIL